MLGARVMRKAGWDTHGLPVELEVEKKLGISGKPQIEQYGVAKFNAQCRESVWTYKKDWEELSERIGYWLDYQNPYITYSEDYVESVWYLLKRFHEAGLVYHGRRVLPYCGRCGTGLSSHELGQPGVYRDVQDPSVTVRFRLAVAAGAEPESFLAWTTTPWTLPSNFALVVNPGVDYVRSRVRHKLSGGEFVEIVWVAKARAEAVLPKGFEVLETLPGSALVGRAYERLYDNSAVLLPNNVVEGASGQGERHRVYAADFVTTEDGTGIVHQAAYGVDDWEVATRERIATFLGPQQDGRFHIPVFVPGTQTQVVPVQTWFKDADPLVIEDLKQRHLLFRNARENHSYPHCWRCDTPLYYFPSPAWYIRTTAYKQRMIDFNKRIRWVPPEVGEKRFGEWLENNVDWNISRDRYWGTPLPFWVCSGCEFVQAIGSAAELASLAGSLPAGFDNHKPLIDEVVLDCPKCSGKQTLRRTKAVLDCWFDSGAMPFAQYHWPFGEGRAKLAEQFPADFIAEGLDQTRGWFYTLHAIGSFVTSLPDAQLPDGPTFKTCAVNGLVLDKDGVKMSKRLGNVVDPWAMIREHGVDAVRWYLLSSGSPWQPKRFDPEGLLEVRRRLIGTLTESYKFFSMYARLPDGFDPARDTIPPPQNRPEIDRWLLSRTQSLVAEVRRAYDAIDLDGACHAIEGFVIDELSNWYIRRNRRRVHKSGKGSEKTAAFATLHAALEAVALLVAPLMPYLAEMLYARLASGKGSVHAALMPEPDETLVDRELEASMRIVTRIVEMGRALRERAGMKIRQPLRAIHIRSSHEHSLELLRTPFAREQILGELNIRDFGTLSSDDGKLCTLRAKANFRVLGKRLGARMKAAATAIEALEPERVAILRSGKPVEVQLAEGPVEVGPEDVSVTVESRADFDIETDGRFVIFLDTQLDDELLAEGLLRELISRVNALRKKAGLAVTDRIRLWLDAGRDPLLAAALGSQRALISEETLAPELVLGGTALGSALLAEELDLGGGHVVHARLWRL
ncbi:MAG: isoleucine--tRNA ligase [Planctomycetes bacterium]|nr:isoleucine--tRNA ligase [Planctomycetota bacterium]